LLVTKLLYLGTIQNNRNTKTSEFVWLSDDPVIGKCPIWYITGKCGEYELVKVFKEKTIVQTNDWNDVLSKLTTEEV